MIIDFTVSFPIKRLLDSLNLPIYSRDDCGFGTLSKGTIFIRSSQPSSANKWCLVQGDKKKDVLFYSELIKNAAADIAAAAAEDAAAAEAATEIFNGKTLDEMQEEYFDGDTDTDANDDDSSDDGSDSDLDVATDAADNDNDDGERRRSNSNASASNRAEETNDEKLTIMQYIQKLYNEFYKKIMMDMENGLNEACAELEVELGTDYSLEEFERFINVIKENLLAEGDRPSAAKIDFRSIEGVPLRWRSIITEAFAKGFGIQSGEERQHLVDLVDEIFAKRFDEIFARINAFCKKNVEASRSKKNSEEFLKKKNLFVSEKETIREILEKFGKSFDATYKDNGVRERMTAYEEAYKKSPNLPDEPPAPSTGNVFLVMSGPAEKLFKPESIYENIFVNKNIDTGVHNVMNVPAFLSQLDRAFGKAEELNVNLVLSTNANAFTYPVQTIPKTVNGEEINKFTRNPNAYLKQSKNAPIPLPPNFSWLKERLPIASCFRQPMANYDKCLTKWLQHTIKKIVDVERETFKAALEPETQKEETQKETVIIQLYVDLTRLRGPGSAVVEKMIQDYAKREMLLNMKVAMDFASERNFRITVGSRWFFKHLVEYVKTEPSSTNIFREWEIGKVEDVLAKADSFVEGETEGDEEMLMDVDDSFGEGETEGDEAMSMDIHVDGSFGEGETEGDEEMLKKVLKTELNNAKGTIFKVTATPKENANGNKNVVELYNHRHLSRALMSGGNTTFFAIAILKLVAVFGFSLPEAIQRARSTYFFNNLLSRSVVRSSRS